MYKAVNVTEKLMDISKEIIDSISMIVLKYSNDKNEIGMTNSCRCWPEAEKRWREAENS